MISGSKSEAQESDKEGRKASAKMCNVAGGYFKRLLLMREISGALGSAAQKLTPWGKKRETLISSLSTVRGGAKGIKLPYVSRFSTCEP